MLREVRYKAGNGYLYLFSLLIIGAGAVYRAVYHARMNQDLSAVGMVVLAVIVLVLLTGLFTVQPNDARVLVLFGNYKGSVVDAGFWWANPFLTKTRVSLRVRNFETSKLKVNDAQGNPIEIGGVIVWKVVDTAEALFEVDDYEEYVKVQSEAALRALASKYPYDAHDDGAEALSTHQDEVSLALKRAMQDRLEKAGVQVMEARLSHLAYAPEIAQAMLQRQQASAIIAARRKIVEGAVGMVEQALEMLNEKQVVALDDEKKASMVSNLLVVLCSERATAPVVNTGTLY
jgi:regulator of protease activity HflC (stomatin/prohibitin superfamily)